MVAFVVELWYGVLCWWIYRGSRALLTVVVAGNLANVSLFFAGIAAPEQLLAGHPMFVVTLVFAQIVTMLVLVRLFSSNPTGVKSPSSIATHRNVTNAGRAESPRSKLMS